MTTCTRCGKEIQIDQWEQHDLDEGVVTHINCEHPNDPPMLDTDMLAAVLLHAMVADPLALRSPMPWKITLPRRET